MKTLTPTQRSRARQLRRQETDAERRLWSRLRNRALGVKFRRQHPIGPYVVDFCCLEAGLVVELDGSQHAEEQLDHDRQRTAFLGRQGFRVVRFWNNELCEDFEQVLERIYFFALGRPRCSEEKRKTIESPSPQSSPIRERKLIGPAPVLWTPEKRASWPWGGPLWGDGSDESSRTNSRLKRCG